MKNILFVVTIPHTGTRSLMNVVDVDGYVRSHKLLNETKERRKDKNRTEVYTFLDKKSHHIYLGEFAHSFNILKSAKLYKGLEKDPLIRNDIMNIIHGHISEDTINAINYLKKYTRIITTCRDPLLTLISVNQRDKFKSIEGKPKLGTSMRNCQMFEAWYLWANFVYPANPFIVPIDLRQEKLMYNKFDLSVIYDINVTNPNNKGGYPLRTAYEEGDLDFIKQELGENYDILLDMKPKLKPVLEDIGYEGLLWWK